MPRYYIDTDDDVLSVRDEEGQEFANVEATRHLAHVALSDMMRHKLPDGEPRIVTASLRDESGSILYVATLTLAGEWRGPPSAK